MASSSSSPRLSHLLLSLIVVVLAVGHGGGEARQPAPLHGVRPMSFDEGYTQIFGSGNLALRGEGKRVHLSLDETTGSGFASQDRFLHGFFSAAVKLPADYAAGVVVAFYLTNVDKYEKTHDELDFEFLGNVRGRDWRVQTNVYGNGSTGAGREERYDLPFDPTEDFHHYSILWTRNRIIFYVDETAIREVARTAAMGAAFPSKPMSLYATIWDGSAWATLGGRYRADYKYAPFVAQFGDLVMQGCPVSRSEDHRSAAAAACEPAAAAAAAGAALSAGQRRGMAAFRRGHMSYSYCHDRRRYPVALSECAAAAGLRRLFGQDGMRYGADRRHRRAGRGRGSDVAM